MKSNEFEKPKIYVTKDQTYPISQRALLNLMQAVFEKGMSFRFKAMGFSMSPFIKDGDIIVVSPFNTKTPKKGEVIAFIHPKTDKLLVHRIIDKQAETFLLRGDNVHNCSDGIIDSKDLLGYVTRIDRKEHRVRIGLGPERLIIAWFSRVNVLIPLKTVFVRFYKIYLKLVD